jgi:hypothetical protein
MLPRMSLQHVVLFSFPEPLSPAEEAEMRAHVAAWPEAIGGFGALRLGTDLTGARTRGYSHLLYMELADLSALEAYRDHPVHQEFLAWLDARDCTPLAFDYVLDEATVLV